jgi:hypothetical protein
MRGGRERYASDDSKCMREKQFEIADIDERESTS